LHGLQLYSNQLHPFQANESPQQIKYKNIQPYSCDTYRCRLNKTITSVTKLDYLSELCLLTIPKLLIFCRMPLL
jgi:hypothetical protein